MFFRKVSFFLLLVQITISEILSTTASNPNSWLFGMLGIEKGAAIPANTSRVCKWRLILPQKAK